NKEFEAFIIDLHPQKSIGALKEIHSIDSLLDEDIFEEIFYEFYKQIRQEFFDISEVRYRSKESSYRLSLINKKCKNGEVGKLVQSIRNNR
ncbi:ABC-three component system protein, partial [Streptococcus equi]